MPAHRKPRKFVPLGAVLSVLVAAALGGYALADGHAAEPVNLAQASTSSGKDATVYSCPSPGKLTRASAATAAKCPATPDPVTWAARSGSPSSPDPLPSLSSPPSASASSPADPAPSTSATPPPSPSATLAPSTSATPPPSPDPSPSPTPTPSPSGSGTPCVTSADHGSCGPYDYPDITGSDGSNTNVIQDVWNPVAGASQTLTAYNPGDWSVSADMPASNTAVVSYPDVQQIYTTPGDTPDPLSSFTAITSTFAESGPGSGGGDDYEAAYDIWTGTGSSNYAQEIMIWVDNHGQVPAGSQVGTADIDGTSYGLWSAGSNPVTLVLGSNETSGTINILAALDWLGSNGYLPAGSGLNQIDFGWEICSTGGTAKTFSLTQYSIQSS